MRENITKSMLVDVVVSQLGLMHTDAKRFVERFFSHITAALLQGEEVALSGFGNFVLLDKKARPGCNPKQPDQRVQISPRTVVSFHAGRKLRKHVQRLSLLAVPPDMSDDRDTTQSSLRVSDASMTEVEEVT